MFNTSKKQTAFPIIVDDNIARHYKSRTHHGGFDSVILFIITKCTKSSSTQVWTRIRSGNRPSKPSPLSPL